MATSVTTSTAVVGTVAAQYLPELTITCEGGNLRPNTTYYPFFGGTNVSQYCYPTTSTTPGASLVTDVAGTLSLYFNVPANVFATGVTTLQLRDTLSDPSSLPTGASYSYANATFNGTGTVTEYQTTITTTVTNVVVEDPLAQQFFTYGVTGGCYITKIDVYFYTQDSTVPVTCELRKMTNGYPSSTMVNQYAKTTLYPAGVTSSYGQTISNVVVSTDASLASTFTFPQPIYLEEDQEYCFVLKSASNQYQVWTATVGQKSQETGLTIIQPTYTGSMFKSQNNLTWVATPSETIKFTIYQAQFNTGVQGDLEFYTTPTPVAVKGQYFVTVSGSPLITYNCPINHNLTVGSYITINTQVGATYNGIPAASFSGDFQIVSVLNPYTVQFNVSANATSSGPITSSGIVNGYSITSAGSSYSSTTPPTVAITGTGSGATATATVKDGKIYTIQITNAGSGYTSAPTAVISSVAGGSGGVIALRVDPVFSVIQNMRVNSANPLLNLFSPTGTSVTSNVATTDSNYEGGSLVSYTLNTEVGITPNKFNAYAKNSMLATPANEKYLMSNTPSSQINVILNSNNSNVSPAIDILTTPAVLQTAYYNVNSQSNEETSGYGIGTQATGFIGRINVISGGSGYTGAPTVSFTSVDGNGSGAAGTANLGGINGITISNGGSGYTTPPTVAFSSGAAAGYAQITNGAVTAIYLTNTGSAYGSAPTISFSGGGGTGAAATATIAASTVVSGITITNAGTGYTATPTVTLTPVSAGSGASATAILVPFNTELSASGGNARARFVTESMQLSAASTGLRVYSTLYSSSTSSVDVYARTVLASSGTSIETVSWVQMRCSVTRNQSKSKSDYFEYVFSVDNLSSFDTFQLKFVMRASNPNDPPIVTSYSAISLA